MLPSFRVISFFDPDNIEGLWGLYKIFHPNALPKDSDVVESHALGSNVDIYFIDSGISANHIEFKHNPFKTNSISTIFIGPPNSDTLDYCGHGTHIASIIVGKSRGVAPGANLYSLKIFDAVPVSTPATLIAALDRVVEHIQNKKIKNPSIVHMSFSLRKNADVENKVRQLTNMGVLCVTVAGYENDDPLELSPAGMSEVITVSGYDKNMEVATREVEGLASKTRMRCYSGDKVDIFAPGQDIEGASPAGDDKYIFRSGASVAAAFVTGVAACYLEKNPAATPQEVKNHILDSAHRGLMKLPANSNKNNLVLFNIFQDMSPVWVSSENSYLGAYFWGQEVNLQLEASSRVFQPVTFKVVQGALPEGLQLSESGKITGKIIDTRKEGSPPAARQYFSIVLNASDTVGSSEQLFYFVVTTKDMVDSPDNWSLDLVKASSGY